MFLHTCGGVVYLKVIDAFELLVENPVISARKLSFPGMIIIREKEEGFKVSFVCSSCDDKVIPVKEIRVRCGNCGELLELRDGYKLANLSGIYCDKCIKRLQMQGNSSTPFSIFNSIKNYLKE
jgi:predicted RNA-binding Zn-ribbon protein involved in translation (DUF1610 family)